MAEGLHPLISTRLLCSPEVVLAAGLVLGADQAGAVDTVHHQTGGRGAWAGVHRTFPTLLSLWRLKCRQLMTINLYSLINDHSFVPSMTSESLAHPIHAPLARRHSFTHDQHQKTFFLDYSRHHMDNLCLTFAISFCDWYWGECMRSCTLGSSQCNVQ